jgi:hypothetical protein
MQFFTALYCYKTKRGRKNWEPIYPEMPTLQARTFKLVLHLLQDAGTQKLAAMETGTLITTLSMKYVEWVQLWQHLKSLCVRNDCLQ